MTAELTPSYPLGYKPIAHFSGLLVSVMNGQHPYEQTLATEAFAVQKSTLSFMGIPMMLYAEDAVFAAIQKAKTTQTSQRVSGYEVTKGKEICTNSEVDLPVVKVADQVFIQNLVRKWKEKRFEGRNQ
ncbi:hypothetical protein NDU88_006725 [Pleurodeles waltl]|uniref:Uncharacterized protein n=1 Tax=Pleurodeles waltl TaxID=8319 RepID=A0AAV7WYE5_PLEWA|nr:hypothetical protein NDU88_006725 [Pleurodeles waltl]